MNKEYFEKYIEKIPEAGCWIWMRSIDKDGYGYAYDGFKVIKAHRLFYEEFIGRIPNNLHVLHRCDVRCCVNPRHLYVGTAADNVRDQLIRAKPRTVCDRGHSLVGENLYLFHGIYRCRVCKRESVARRKYKEP